MIHVLSAATAPAVVAPAPAYPSSGEYGPMKLAFADGQVTGSFKETRMGNGTEEAPQFSCTFAIAGAWRGGVAAAQVLTWWPGDNSSDERIRGRLSVRGGTATLKLDEDPGGCSMTGEQLKDDGFSEALSERRAWLEVRQIRSARVRFSDTPGGSPRRSYVTRGDIVGVEARAGDFVRVEYVDGSRPVEGWLPVASLEPSAP